MSSPPLKVSRAATALTPSLRVERAFLRDDRTHWVVGCDEVGRGALAGPVAVGLAVVGKGVKVFPRGLRDSKAMTQEQREAIVPRVCAWLHAFAIGTASSQEIDDWGLTVSLQRAATRAFEELLVAIPAVCDPRASTILLDGKHDYLTPTLGHPVRVETRVGADRDCASVSAAAVLAKVHRDQIMTRLGESEPHFFWHTNKGYGTPQHRTAIATHGVSEFHRKTWLGELA